MDNLVDIYVRSKKLQFSERKQYFGVIEKGHNSHHDSK